MIEVVSIDARFVDAARRYIGVPWVHQGRSSRGVDCIGLVVLAARDCGLDVAMEANYGRTQNYAQMKPLLIRHCVRVGDPGEGVVVLFKNSALLHLAVMSGVGTVIHAFGPQRCVIESTINFEPMQYWRPKWP